MRARLVELAKALVADSEDEVLNELRGGAHFTRSLLIERCEVGRLTAVPHFSAQR